MSRPSNIRVFPTFTDTAFFSGEEFSCTLTFKNIAEPSSSSSSSSSLSPPGNGRLPNKRSGSYNSGEWINDTTRLASRGLSNEPGKSRGLRHVRSRSTVGGTNSENTRSNNMQRSHSRTQSLLVSSTTVESPAPLASMPQTDKFEGKPLR